MWSTLFYLIILANPVPFTSRLKAPEARPIALKSIIDGTHVVESKNRSRVEQILINIVQDRLNFDEQVYAVRALGKLEMGVPLLLDVIVGPFATERKRALAIEATRALTGFAPPKSLSMHLGHAEPEIRALVARTGGPTPILCALLEPIHGLL